jgi:SAM-dependent MidA family methyltransferase
MFPALSEPQLAQVRAVQAAVRVAIQSQGGWLSFADYLQLVLYAPGLGYYSAGATKFGPAGDFTTAPELSALFGGCVARQCAFVLHALGGADMLELGAGSGALAASVLPRLEQLGALPERYFILEVSADLRERQRQRMAILPQALRERVQWLERLPDSPLRAVVVANEVADALPFERFAVTASGVVERGVALDDAGQFTWADRPASERLRLEVQRVLADLPAPPQPGFVSELCPRLDGWIAGVADALESGVLLLFDYGLGRSELYHPTRSDGTLRCHYRHRAHDDPFLHPGMQDITAWVDFTRVAEAAAASNLEIAGYCTQAAFLLGAGIESELAAVSAAAGAEPGTRRQVQFASEARQLLLPGEMGETFKAMGLTKNFNEPLAGFAVQDLRRLL